MIICGNMLITIYVKYSHYMNRLILLNCNLYLLWILLYRILINYITNNILLLIYIFYILPNYITIIICVRHNFPIIYYKFLLHILYNISLYLLISISILINITYKFTINNYQLYINIFVVLYYTNNYLRM